MRRRRRMNGERASVSDVGDVIEHLKRVDEATSRFAPTGQFETNEAAESALKILGCSLAGIAGLLRGMNDPCHLRPLRQVGSDGGCVLAVALDAQRQRFDALYGLESVERRDRGT